MNRTACVEDRAPRAQQGARRPARRTRRGSAVISKFLRAVELSSRELRAAYPYVAYLVQALSKTQPRKPIRRRGHRFSLPHAAQA